MRIAEVFRAADMIVKDFLDTQPSEEVLILGDTETQTEILYALAGAVESAKAEPVIMILPGRDRFGVYPLRTVDQAVHGPDIVIMCTKSQDTTHMPAIQKLRWQENPKTRVFSMIGRDIDSLTKGAARADYQEVFAVSSEIHRIFEQGKSIRIASDLGTDLRAEIGFSKACAGYNRTPRRGQLGCFPDGEVNTGPVEGTAEGVFVVDGPVSGRIYSGFPEPPIRITVQGGKAIRIEGGTEATKLRDVVEATENANNIAEIAIGTNPAARFVEDVMEFKRGSGRVHVALGDNIDYGGTTRCRVHLDLALTRPTVAVDGKIIVDQGKLRVGS